MEVKYVHIRNRKLIAQSVEENAYAYMVEGEESGFTSIPQSIYWAIVTITTVGYGDISPVTPIGRALTIVLSLMGIGIFAIPAALLASSFSDELVKERDALKANIFHVLKDGHICDFLHPSVISLGAVK